MVDDDVLGANRGKAVAAEVADTLGEARVVGREREVGALVDDDRLTSPIFTMLSRSKTCTVSLASSSWSNRKSRSSVGIAVSTEIEIRSPRRRRFKALS